MIVEKGLLPSRTKAQALILAGRVKVNGQIVNKVGALISGEASLELVQTPRYVSRGGEKLEGALADFQFSPEGLVCLDTGASTGGFTDCLLQHGAKKVYAVDVGRAQLDDSIRTHPQVTAFEETHILDLTPSHLESRPSLAVIDVSFISVKRILPHVMQLLSNPATVIALVKPQFEVGPKFLKKGVVRSVEVQRKAVDDIIAFGQAQGWAYLGQAPSRLKGPKGNQEYFVHFRKED